MLAKFAVVAIVFAVAQAGEEPPPPKVHTYNVPSVAKVSYPGPAVTKSVETYSAPSIEKTTTITRTITAPLNAPAVKSVQYSAPAPPVIPVAHAPVGHGPAYGAPGAFAGHGPAFAAFPYPYAQPAVAYAHGPVKGYAQPTLSLSTPLNLGFSGAGAYSGFAPGVTTYSAPQLGYSLGGGYAPVAVAAAPVAVAAAAPAAVAVESPAPATASAPAPAPAKKGGYN